MNHWEILIIPLIAFGAWILSTIFKANEVEKNKNRPRRVSARARPQAPPPDKYYDAAGRRRDMPEGMESHPGKTRNVPAPVIAQRRPVAPRPPGQRRPAPVLATVIEEPPRTIIRQSAPVETAPVTLPVSLPPATTTSPIMAPAMRNQPVSPVLQEVVRLLRSPRTAAAALVMREILDKPVGLRRR